MVRKRSIGEYIFDCLNIIIMILLMIVTIYPLYYVAVCSISQSSRLLGMRGLILSPQGFNLDAYKAVFANPNVFSGYRTTIIVTIGGTLLNVFMTSVGAFLMTRQRFAVKKAFAYMITFTMFFSGGMIPTYFVVYKVLGLGDSLWALILPTVINTYNMIIMKSNFESIPNSLEEAAKIDGANDLILLFGIILPLSIPTIAVMFLFYGVSNWNSWVPAMMYIRTRSKYPLQLILREILIMNDTATGMGSISGSAYSVGMSIKYATIMVATIPILCLYPFIQKYFIKGMMIGAVKG